MKSPNEGADQFPQCPPNQDDSRNVRLRRIGQRLSAADKVVIVAIIGGFGGGVLCYVFHLAPIITSVLIATGATSLVYRFLGGIEGATFVIGTLKLGGAMAALVGVTFYVDGRLAKELPTLRLSNAELVGDWKWVWGAGAWDGHLYFRQEDGQIRFDGQECHYDDPYTPKSIYRIFNGVASLDRDRSRLTLEFDADDLRLNRQLHLRTTEPMVLVPAFRGDLVQTVTNGPSSSEPWGMMIYRRPVGAP